MMAVVLARGSGRRRRDAEALLENQVAETPALVAMARACGAARPSPALAEVSTAT